MARRLLFATFILALLICLSASAGNLSVQFSDKPAGEVFQELARQAGVTILVESSVKGNVTISANDVSFESAMTAVCQSPDVQWRKVYVKERPGEELKADSLIAVLRIISAARLPDVVVSEPASDKPMIFSKRTKLASTPEDMVKDAGLKLVYLVSNDRAAAKKAEETAKSGEKSTEKTAAEKYAEKQADMLNDFLAMTPEERTEAMRQSMNMMMQMDPRIMQEMMRATMESMDPNMMAEASRLSMQMIANMPADKLANFLQRQMQASAEMMRSLPPEVMQKLMKAMGYMTPPPQTR